MAASSGFLGNMKLLTKICLIVSVPTVGLLFASASQIIEKRNVAAQMNQTSQMVDLASDVSVLAHSLQREAAASAAFVSSGHEGDVSLADLQRASAAAGRAVTERSRSFDLAGASAELKQVLDDGLSKADGIAALRSQVSGRSVAAAQMNGAFTGAIVRLLDFSSFAPKAIENPAVARAMRVYAYLLQAAEASSAARANAATGFGAGAFDGRTYQTVMKFLNRQADFVALLDQTATPAQRDVYADTYSGRPVADTARMVQVMMDAGPGGSVSSVTQDAWLAANADRMKLYGAVEKHYEDDLRAAALEVKDVAEWYLAMQIAASATLLALTGGLAFLIARSITRPLNELVAAMDGLAQGNVAQEIPHTERHDEMGNMARSVLVFKKNGVQLQASEREATETRRITEDHRVRSDAERAAVTAQQAEVVEAIGTGLGNLSNGHLTFRLTEGFPSDYERLRHDFNGAMEKLQETMALVSTNTSAIRSGTDEISSASDDLSKRTEQQAASLEETAAALDEITATVRKTAEGSKHARHIVGQAKQAAEHSGRIVRQAVEAMSGIEKSAGQIGNIIGVIDEIAFQTNLLALNAGVEAARAGDAGRGFAVVASEVRALAQRSADAAKEIKALISASSQQVEQGVDLVGQTGVALEKIVAQVAEINGIVGEIAASAQEQASGLDQVNTAVNQMDQVTQQNAAMVEESTAASHALARETEELARLIGQFDIGETGRPAAPRPRPATRPAAKASMRSKLVTALKTVGGGGAARKPAPEAHANDWQEF